MLFYRFPAPFLYLAILLFTLGHLPASYCQVYREFNECGKRFRCGNFSNLDYPFWGGDRQSYCGHPAFQLNCQENVTFINLRSKQYRVLGVDTRSQVITVAREDLWNNTCPSPINNTDLDYTLFSHPSDDQNLTLSYGCASVLGQQSLFKFDCPVNGARSDSYFTTRDAALVAPNIAQLTCDTRITVPINQTSADALSSASSSENDLKEVLKAGFRLKWDANDSICNECARPGGRCGYNSSTSSFACYCSDRQCNLIDSGKHGKSTPKLSIVISVVGAVIAGAAITWLYFFWWQRRKQKTAQSATHIESKDHPATSAKSLTTATSTHFTKSIPSYTSSGFGSGKGSTYFGVQVFDYAELEEATDNFNPSRELGDGGFGTVYYGTLQDGRVVAVKRLYENNFKRVQQFMNEVEILTKLDHKNLVKLYGCTSKRSRDLLLVYEYIPNGTVADHLHGKQANSGLLSWSVRLKIAIETAEALAYLHVSGIIHRDVKSNNILLDNSFCVKVADFGLSRLNPNNATHVSTAPQGTPGYVDPEYYKLFQLTDKSDVYSFGVVLVELISSLPALDSSRDRLDINLASMAISKIQNQTINELIDPRLGFKSNASVEKMTTLVAELAFRCLQEEKDLRPTMQEVVDTLKEIQCEDSDAQKAVVLDIRVEEVAPLKGKEGSFSPDSVADKWISNSTSIHSE
ncbi:LEAF RUST 10 DISEASE-RESISTANCE LOCUS RECEPTOR-LIKE PROTEIN KINASE-like 1.2 isoform X2 [Daucus carota subsp. sativus]|uniref:LEAF RUST 10 DISEASE-RESISTANCE LOCUS RECEPTOR-LIKE PROTEIN KINASE-like 1.2 isoform X2 n=1 Tax=Daucus carota subsp. sativus TaxID=79200 RepID=UPI0007EF0C1B|nr:PREDICTED: LEAF RUST 10 DISEASE-RESISTANCE LOCUS RECEPTOR-LIKE PROTEIN KINASE-like 1.2 isoform X2 [Daucus carota subsp. sativus]